MATILGTTGADQLGASGMTLAADRISAGAGTDTLVYDLATAGGADTYYGGTGVDSLELNLTAAEWAIHRVKVLALQKAVNDAAKPSAGAVAGGTNFGKLDFGNGKTLQVYEVEAVKIFIDGNLYTGDAPVNKAVSLTSAAQAGGVTEDGTLSASGAVEFVDADLADAHQASFVAAAGQTALGTFELDTVNEDAESADGMVSWTYNLDNASAAVQALAAGQVVTERYTVSVTDGKGSTVQQVVTITITGMADAPPIVMTDSGAVVEAGTGNAGTPEAGGKMPLEGVAPSAVWETYVSDEVVADGYSNGYEWGTFTITPAGQWKFTLDQAKADALADGEELLLTFAVTATEDGQESVRREVTVTLTGTDDKTTVTAEAGADTAVVEAGGIANSTNDDAGASGKLNLVDPDDASVTFISETVSGTYGDLNIDANGNWGYSLRNGDANVQALKEGQSATDSMVVKATDGTTHTVKISITGADDAASMSVVDTLALVVDADGFLLKADGVTRATNAAGDELQVSVAESKYDNLVHEAPGKDHAGKVDYVATGKLSLVDPDGGSLGFHALDAEVREDELFEGSVAQGTYGSFTLNTATGEWVYTLDNNDEDTQDLKHVDDLFVDGVSDSVVVYSADGKSSETITVYIQGEDDGYSVIVADETDPTANTTVFEETTQDLDGDGKADVDGDGKLILVLDGEAHGKLNAIDPDDDAPVDAPFAPVIINGKYGKLEILDDQGTWTYTANVADEDTDPTKDSDGDKVLDNDVNIKSIERLAKGQVVTESFLIKTSDEAASYAINVRLTGADDRADLYNVVTDAVTGEVTHVDHNGLDAALPEPTHSVIEAGGVNNTDVGVKTTTGVLLFKDGDDGESGFASTTPATKAGLYGTFKLNTTTGAWSYDLDNTKVNQLKANETVVDQWEVTSKGGSKDLIMVNVIGTDDATTITAAAGGDYVAKESGGINNAVKGDTVAKGTLTIADPDGGAEDSEASFASLFSTAGGEGGFDAKNVAKAVDEASFTFEEPTAATAGKIWGQYGSFTFAADTGAWVYTLVETATASVPQSVAAAANNQQLAAGEKAMDVLRVYGSNMSSYFDVKVNITGANDGATITNDVPSSDLVVQAPGFEKAADVDSDPLTPLEAIAVTEALSLSGTLSVEDTDSVAAVGFKPISANAAGKIVATYGSFTFDAASGAWTYDLNTNDKETRALLIGQSAIDKLNVSATDGTVYTISVKVNGANNAPEVLNHAVTGDPLVSVNKDGTITYTVADGDAGAKLTLQVVEAGVVRDVSALTVVDGGVSTVKAATANSTVLYTGMMQVTDKTVDHDAAQLNTYLGMGTKNADLIDSTAEAPSVGSLISSMDGNDTVNTGAGTDYISAGNGNDSVTSDDGNDTIIGGAGNDTIDAGAGDDRIQADAGVDVLLGGDGADTFVFMTMATDFVKATATADSIADFATGEDKLLLSKALLPTTYYTLSDAFLADGVTAGKDGIFETIKLAKAVTGAGIKGDLADGAWFRDDLIATPTGMIAGLSLEDRFVFDATTGTLWYDADGKSSTAAVKVAQDLPGLSADDFQFA